MYVCLDCGHSFHDNAGSWTTVDDRDELLEDAILKCPTCNSRSLDVADQEEEDELLEYEDQYEYLNG